MGFFFYFPPCGDGARGGRKTLAFLVLGVRSVRVIREKRGKTSGHQEKLGHTDIDTPIGLGLGLVAAFRGGVILEWHGFGRGENPEQQRGGEGKKERRIRRGREMDGSTDGWIDGCHSRKVVGEPPALVRRRKMIARVRHGTSYNFHAAAVDRSID